MTLSRYVHHRDSPSLAKASRWNFGCESLHVQLSCCLDVVVYMLNCVFWRHIPLEIEFKSRGSDSNAQRYHPLAVAQLVTPKKNRKIERGEFITPPRPTGRRSNE